MREPPRPTDSRAARAWVAAFQNGFKRSPAVLEPNTDELVGLLEEADLRILNEPADLTAGKPKDS